MKQRQKGSTTTSLQLKVKKISISTGGVLVALLHEYDAKRIDCDSEDRIRISAGKTTQTVIVDVTSDKRVIMPGHIGLFVETARKLRHNQTVHISLERRPESLFYIRKKLDGHSLTKNEIYAITKDIVDDKLSDAELTFFVAGCYSKGLSMQETAYLTKAMVETGERLDVHAKPIMDKHCIGGVPGNRTTMVVIPIVAAAGLTIPKTSSRSITSPAGTADTVEVLTRVELSPEEMKKAIKKTGACMVWGGAMNLAPADDKIIRIEKLLSIDAQGQLLASVMAKKHSVGATHCLIDIPVGKSCKSKTYEDARKLRNGFVTLGKMLGIHVHVEITDGSQPIGRGIGPYLEAQDVMAVLRNEPSAPQDLRAKAIMMAGILLEMGGKARKHHGRELARKLLDDGSAHRKMQEIISAQGKPKHSTLGKYVYTVRATRSGHISAIDNKLISKCAHLLGCPENKGSGILLAKHAGDSVRMGDTLFTMYAESISKLKFGKEFYSEFPAYTIE